MDPSQTYDSPSSAPASGCIDISSVQTTSSAMPFVTYSGFQWQIRPGVIAVPLNEKDPLKEYTTWNGQAVELNHGCCFTFIGFSLLQKEKIGC
ncbi:hypothetical protein GJ744_008289 [Endocarpon pusillum]|uniref:Uncharacterized protein n=1 Tax=Endocarpon pusillum TaxID=364733 RepID=A0A8H7E3J2_9EURO|nr:hypothetical protein GJ744_008289 [Endocarpon pusillum]